MPVEISGVPFWEESWSVSNESWLLHESSTTGIIAPHHRKVFDGGAFVRNPSPRNPSKRPAAQGQVPSLHGLRGLAKSTQLRTHFC